MYNIAMLVLVQVLLTRMESLAFVYPYLETALVGQFGAGVMISARPARLESVEMVGAIMTPVFSIQASPVVSFCKSNQYSLGDNPLVPDPYEARTCQVGSPIVPFHRCKTCYC